MNRKERYTSDERMSFVDIYANFDILLDHGWEKELISQQTEAMDGEKISMPVYAYTFLNEKKPTKSLWIFSGIHGEEPAGPNALAKSIDTFIYLSSRKIPMLIVPLWNPIGYSKDSRYYDGNNNENHSVTDSSHVLPNHEGSNKTMAESPLNKYCKVNIDWVIKKIKRYKPILLIDHHEDSLSRNDVNIDAECTYSYLHGDRAKLKEVCKLITKVLISEGFPVQVSGTTRFGEEIRYGFVTNTSDGSVDQLIAENSYYDDASNSFIEKSGAVAIVIETTRDDRKINNYIPLGKRVKIHKEIVNNYEDIWEKIKGLTEKD